MIFSSIRVGLDVVLCVGLESSYQGTLTYTSGGPPEVYVSICQGPFGCNAWPRQAHRFIPTHTSQWVRVQEKPVNSGQ